MKPKHILLLIYIGIFQSSIASDSLKFSVAEAIAYAKENNSAIHAGKLELQKASYRIKEITGTGLPQINGSFDFRNQIQLPVFVFPDPTTGEQTPIQVGTKYQAVGSLSLNQLIFDGSYFLGLKAAKEYKLLTERLFDKDLKDLEVNVAKTYFLTIITKQNAFLIEENLNTLKQSYKETESLYKEGFVEKLDVERLKLSVSNLEVQKAKVQDAQMAATNLLKAYLGLDFNQSIKLTDDLETLFQKSIQTVQMSQDGSEKNRPEVKVLEQQMEMNRLDMERYKVMRYPTVRGFVNYQEQFFGDKLDFNPWFTTSLWGLSVNVPIFSSGVNKNQIRQASLSLDQNKLNLQYNLSLLKMQRLNAERDLNTSIIRVNQQKENFELAKDITQTTMIKYQEGVGSNLEVINANQELKNAQSNYLEALYEVLVNNINLQVATGSPIKF